MVTSGVMIGTWSFVAGWVASWLSRRTGAEERARRMRGLTYQASQLADAIEYETRHGGVISAQLRHVKVQSVH